MQRVLCTHSYIGDCCRESYPLFIQQYNVHPAPRHTSPKRYTSPLTYRENSSYPAERKASFSRRKSAFTQWYSSVYLRSLKDQVRQSKSPRTQILDPRTQSTLFCHLSITFIPYAEQQPNRGHFTKLYGISPKLYSFLHHPNIALPTYPYWVILCAYHRMTLTHDLHTNSFVRESLPYWRRVEAWHSL